MLTTMTTTRATSDGEGECDDRRQRQHLPVEVWGRILFFAVESVQELARVAPVTRAIHSHTWGSPAFKAMVIIATTIAAATPTTVTTATSLSKSNMNADSVLALTRAVRLVCKHQPDDAAADFLEILVQKRAITPANWPSATCHFASDHHTNPRMLRILILAGFPVQIHTLYEAVQKARIEIFRAAYDLGVANGALVRIGASEQPIEHVLPHAAAASGSTVMLDVLIDEYGFPVDARNVMDMSPLAIACDLGHHDVVMNLLRRGGLDVNARDMYGHTPLSSLLNRHRNRHLEDPSTAHTAVALVRHGADPRLEIMHIFTIGGYTSPFPKVVTLMHSAAISGTAELMRAILESGHLCHARASNDNSLRSVMLEVVLGRHLEALRVVLEWFGREGVDIGTPADVDRDGRNVLAICSAEGGWSEGLELLRRFL